MPFSPFLPKIEVLLLGETDSGKSSISERYQELGFSHKHCSTICNSFTTKIIPPSLQLWLWDSPGLGKYHYSAHKDYKKYKQFIYCIDLTKPMNRALIEETIKNIRAIRLQEANDNNPVIFLVGTKSDVLRQQKITLAQLEALATEFRCAKAFITSAKKNEGIDELFTEVTTKAQELHAQEESDEAASAAATRAEYIRERDRIETQLHASLRELKAAIDKLPQKDGAKKIALYAEADCLIKALKSTAYSQKGVDINRFYDNCRKIVSQPLSLAMRNVLQAVVFVAIAAIITLICAAIGFTIGLAAGVWLGPGAFVTAIIGGTAAAKAALATSSVIGVCASYYATNYFFKPTPVLVAAQDVKTGARNFYSDYPRDMTDINALSELTSLEK